MSEEMYNYKRRDVMKSKQQNSHQQRRGQTPCVITYIKNKNPPRPSPSTSRETRNANQFLSARVIIVIRRRGRRTMCTQWRSQTMLLCQWKKALVWVSDRQVYLFKFWCPGRDHDEIAASFARLLLLWREREVMYVCVFYFGTRVWLESNLTLMEMRV